MTERTDRQNDSRLNLLLTYSGWREESWADQLPRLLSPMGIRSIKAESGKEAEEVIRTFPVHIAVIDLHIPLEEHGNGDHAGGQSESGARVLQLLRRLKPTPPTVVVRDVHPIERDYVRTLAAALREGAFAVIDHPVRIETMLEVLRRVTRRYYSDLWPSN